MDKKARINEMLSKQNKEIDFYKKLRYFDIVKIILHIDCTIFDNEHCCKWLGKTINSDKKRGTYIPYYFNKKKLPLHRLIYENFVRKLNFDENIKFACHNSNFCCNINHMNVVKVNKKIKENKKMLIVDDSNIIDGEIILNFD